MGLFWEHDFGMVSPQTGTTGAQKVTQSVLSLIAVRELLGRKLLLLKLNNTSILCKRMLYKSFLTPFLSQVQPSTMLSCSLDNFSRFLVKKRDSLL